MFRYLVIHADTTSYDWLDLIDDLLTAAFGFLYMKPFLYIYLSFPYVVVNDAVY